MRKLLLVLLLCTVQVIAAQTNATCAGITPGFLGSFNGFVPFQGTEWTRDISADPVDPDSDFIIHDYYNLDGDEHTKTRPDSTMPYDVIAPGTPFVPVTITAYSDQSDHSYVPTDSTTHIEGNPVDGTTNLGVNGPDYHSLIIDPSTCTVYEMGNTYRAADHSTFTATSMMVWDMQNPTSRPYGWTSVDAAGLSVFAGIIRYDEIVAGEIKHATRFTVANTKATGHGGDFVFPATHAAGNNSNSHIPFGMRIRLKSSFDVSGFSTTNQIILNSWKKYGLIMADNGSTGFFQTTPDARWDQNDLLNLLTVELTNFEVLEMDNIYNADIHPTGTGPSVALNPSATKIALGNSVTFSPTVSNADYSYIDKTGMYRGGSKTFSPTSTTTYRMDARNIFGDATDEQTITVFSDAIGLNLKATAGNILQGYTINLGNTCTFSDTSVLACPITFTGAATAGDGTVQTGATGTITGSAAYGSLTQPLSFTVVARPSQFGGNIAIGGR